MAYSAELVASPMEGRSATGATAIDIASEFGAISSDLDRTVA